MLSPGLWRKQPGVGSSGGNRWASPPPAWSSRARTPHNPTLETLVQGATGPRDSGITNPVNTQYILAIPVEMRHQGQYRREAALANLSGAEWEIANSETLLAIRVAKAFRSVLYQQRKLELLDETIHLNQQVADQCASL